MLNVVRSLSFRPATVVDADVLLTWRNDPVTRAMSRSNDVVGLSEHTEWLTSRLQREQPALYIVEDGDRLVGTFRIDGDEVSYTIAPEMRNKGYATRMLNQVRQQFGVLVAKIFARNLHSIKAATKAGLRVEIIQDELSVKLALIDEIEKVRAGNNVNWMDLLRLAFRVAPDDAKNLIRRINTDDKRISELLSKLSA